jgi:hypothetical protein
MYVETKGRWTAIDRKKIKHVLESNPGIDLTDCVSEWNSKIKLKHLKLHMKHML